jgi:hypothetical protein
MYLIWTLSCERTILKSRKGTVNAWIKAINDRLNTDKITAIRILRRKEHTRLVVGIGATH